MEGELAQGNVGSVGKYDLEFKEGCLVADVKVELGVGQATMSIKLDAGHVLDALAKAIPGTWDDAIIGVAKAALLNK